MSTPTTQKFWQGTNFWVAALLVVLSLFGGGEGLATQIAMSVSGLIAAFFALRQFLSSAKFGGWKETFLQGNTLNYIAQVLLAVGIPNLDQLIPPLKDTINAFIQGNYGAAISGFVSLVTILFYLFKKKA